MATKRSRNVTDAERNILLKLIQPHISIIENIKTGGTSNKIQFNSWENKRHQYNALQSTGERTTIQLKVMFDTMKRKTRKDKSSDRVNTYKYQPNITTTERENEVLVDLLLTNKPSIDSSIDNKDEVWKTIAELYNQLQTSGIKTIDELKKCNKRLQKSASLDINKEKIQTYKTGGGKSEHQSSSISSKVIGMMGNQLDSLDCPYDCDGIPGILQTSYEELPGIAKNQSCGSGSPIYYTVGLDEMVDAQAIPASTPRINVLMKDNIEWLFNSNNSSAKESEMDISIHDNTDQPYKKNDFQTKNKKITAVSSKLHEMLPNKNVPITTHTTANKIYENLENISSQRLG